MVLTEPTVSASTRAGVLFRSRRTARAFRGLTAIVGWQ
jgi:hypothetical protein